MADLIPIRELVLVEGKYDKITLSNVIDATIMTCEGFAVFHNAEKRALLKKLGEARGVILLTDSDGGGRQIRSYLTGLFPPEKIKHLYIPRIEGKEKRKRVASRARVLGVEGMKTDTLRLLFEPFRADAPRKEGARITGADLYAAGLLGHADATKNRQALCDELQLPPLTGKQLLTALGALMTREEFLNRIQK